MVKNINFKGMEKTVKKRVKTIFLSDIHLGTRACKAEFLLDFVDQYISDEIYLIGDIIDLWALKSGIYWPQSHNNVVRKILKRADKGTKVTYVIGNHDEYIRKFLDIDNLSVGHVRLVDECEYVSKTGLKIYVTHGDKYDQVILYAKWLAFLGDFAYSFLLWVNTYLAKIRAKFGLSYWSLSAFLKGKVKEAVSFISSFEDSLTSAAKEKNCDAVICGHIHHGEVKFIGDMLYLNTSDWVESCCGIIEDMDGNIMLQSIDIHGNIVTQKAYIAKLKQVVEGVALQQFLNAQ